VENAVSFWDTIYLSGEAMAVKKNDPVAISAVKHFGDLQGKRLLEIGFGRGEFSLFFAQLGAQVVSVETSQVATERLTRLCEEMGIGNVSVLRSSALEILKAAQFDFVFGNMVLHHIEPFDDFAAALGKSLVPGGKGFFCENNASIIPIALWFRQHVAGKFWFPKYGDDEEFPLTRHEVGMLRKHLDVRVNYPEFRFFRLISLYILRNRVFPGLFALIDDMCFKVPGFRKYSYVQHLFVERRRDSETTDTHRRQL